MINRAIQRAYDILQYLGDQGDAGATLKDITDKIELPKSTAHDIIQTLLHLGLIEGNKYNDKKYTLGLATFSLGMKYSKNNKSFVSICSKYLNPLADKFNRTGFVGVLDGITTIYVYKYMGRDAKLATCQIGTRHECYTTSLGKALVSFLDDNIRQEVVDKIEFKPKTDFTIKTKEDFLKEIEKVKKTGYSIDDKENETMMICFGAPIFDNTNKVIAAISLSDIKSDTYTNEEIGGAIKEAAEKISRELGYTGNEF